VQVVVLAVTIATLARREDLVTSGSCAVVHLARVKSLDVFFQRDVKRRPAPLYSRAPRCALNMTVLGTTSRRSWSCKNDLGYITAIAYRSIV